MIYKLKAIIKLLSCKKFVLIMVNDIDNVDEVYSNNERSVEEWGSIGDLIMRMRKEMEEVKQWKMNQNHYCLGMLTDYWME